MSDYIPIPLKRFAVIIENYTVRYLKGVQVVFALCFSLFELDPPPISVVIICGGVKSQVKLSDTSRAGMYTFPVYQMHLWWVMGICF